MPSPPPPALLIEAIKINGLGKSPNTSQATYRVIDERAGEKRALPRRRTRLRAGKILSGSHRFLADCRIFDRTAIGARLRLCEDVLLPLRIHLFDDEQQALLEADIVWRQHREVGLCFIARTEASELGRDLLSRLRGKYYAVD